jgi:hypothetical protein
MQEWLSSFLEELTKLSAQTELPPESRRKQYLQFGALGATMGPVMGGMSNLIQRGTLTPYQVPLKRWLPAQMTTGALVGGALPVLRDILSRSNIENVRHRHQAEKLLREMAPEGPEKALKKLQRRAGVLDVG